MKLDSSEQKYSVVERSLVDLREDLHIGRISSVELLQSYRHRIGMFDCAGPCLNSVIELNPDAIDIARQADIDRDLGKSLGPLHGIPILIKDNIDTNDAMETTAGSMALVGAPKPKNDAAIVKRLRDSGAVIIGKTNLSEWANFRGSHSTSGWSGRGGLTRNPYALDRSASGSSSGSAVAVAASLCAVAVGTETDGSILCPSAVCGIVGLKPTVGLLSCEGIIPLSKSQDTPGPMARSVQDCAIMLSAMIGDGETPSDVEVCKSFDYRPFVDGDPLNRDALNGARIGVLTPFFGVHAHMETAYAQVLATIQRAGALLIDICSLPDIATLREAEKTVLLYEMKAGLNAYLAQRGSSAQVRSLSDLIEFNKKFAQVEMPWFGQNYLELAQEMGSPEHSDEYREARNTCIQLARENGINRFLSTHGLDAFIAPTVGPAWTIDTVLGDHSLPHSCTLSAVAGTPNITVPATQWHGLPLGLSLMGEAWSEWRLLNLAYSFECWTNARKPPSYVQPVSTTYRHA